MNSLQGSSIDASPRQRGFSLIELMVAMAIGLAVIATVGYVFLGAKMSFNTVEVLAGMQENARYAFEYMGKDIRMAGFTGGPASDSSATNVLHDPPTSGSGAWDGNLRDLFGSVDTTKGGPLAGYEQGGTFPIGVTPKSGTDALMVSRADGDEEFSISAHSPAVFTLSSLDCTSGALPAVGRILVASDHTHSALFQVASASGCAAGAMTIGYTASTTNPTPGNASTALGTFGAGSVDALKLYPLRAGTYFVKDDANGEPTLYRQELGVSGTAAEVSEIDLVHGVSDMQLLYGVDTDATPDESVDYYWNATQVNAGTDGTHSISGVSTVAERWRRVVSVRITLTLTSRQDTKVSTSHGVLTKSFTNTIAVRNRLL